jgi:hypothetical protein
MAALLPGFPWKISGTSIILPWSELWRELDASR